MDFLAAIQPGQSRSVYGICKEENTAAVLKSGSLPVYATPAMAALMEQAAAELTEALLPPGWTSVGTHMDISHIAATPCGLKVRADACIRSVEGRKIVYEVTAFDASGKIGYGSHERFVVERERFLQKAEQKRSAAKEGNR